MCVARTVEFLGSPVTCSARDAPCHNHLGTSVQNIRALAKKIAVLGTSFIHHALCILTCLQSGFGCPFVLFPFTFSHLVSLETTSFLHPSQSHPVKTLQSTHKTPSRNRRNAVNSKHASILAWCADTPDANSETRKARIRPATLPSPRLAANPDPRPFNHPTRLPTPP